ncbi:hypothetical protein HY416_01070 [Candidatus Kaiserbacteria bacterium]|nr:hypothetical protein [Candidatus Kaiserbacteria bacterium]
MNTTIGTANMMTIWRISFRRSPMESTVRGFFNSILVPGVIVVPVVPGVLVFPVVPGVGVVPVVPGVTVLPVVPGVCALDTRGRTINIMARKTRKMMGTVLFLTSVFIVEAKD